MPNLSFVLETHPQKLPQAVTFLEQTVDILNNRDHCQSNVRQKLCAEAQA